MNLPFFSIPLSFLQKEKTIGSDFSGIVLAAGAGSGFAEGDEVLGVTLKPISSCGGTLSKIAHIDLKTAAVSKKPKQLSFVQAAGLGCVFLTARTCIKSVETYVDASSSKRLAILGGSSACGLFEVWLAKQRGWKVVATCSDRNAEFVTNAFKADEIINYTKQNVREAVDKFQPEAIIDNVGGQECIGLSKRYVSIVGEKTDRTIMGGPLSYYFSFLPSQWYHWTLGRLGLGQSYDVITLDLKSELLEEVEDIPVDKIIIDSTFAFEDAKKAYERLVTSRARGKIIVEVS